MTKQQTRERQIQQWRDLGQAWVDEYWCLFPRGEETKESFDTVPRIKKGAHREDIRKLLLPRVNKLLQEPPENPDDELAAYHRLATIIVTRTADPDYCKEGKQQIREARALLGLPITFDLIIHVRDAEVPADFNPDTIDTKGLRLTLTKGRGKKAIVESGKVTLIEEDEDAYY